MKKLIALVVLATFLMACGSTQQVGWSKKPKNNKMMKRKY